MKTEIYTEEFYELRVDSLDSAKVIVPLIISLINPRSVVDIGCGTGGFLKTFNDLGIKDVLGIDGHWVSNKNLYIPKENFISANLEEPINLKRTFDLALSLEVAEHVNETSAMTFVKSLTSLAPVVLFSAAIPFQGGTNHINEQWPEYWVDLFEQQNYQAIDIIRKKIWNNPKVCFWYAQNSLLFINKEVIKENHVLMEYISAHEQYPLSIVHPELYLQKTRIHQKIVKLVPDRIKKILLKTFKAT